MIEKITDTEIEDARKVLESFVVNPLSRESALESGIFCIANQSSRWERPSKIIYDIREVCHPSDKDYKSKYSTLEVLSNPEQVNAIAKEAGWRFHHNNRFHQLINRFSQETTRYWEEIIDANEGTRKKYTSGKEEIKYLGMKTFSFWHLCLGGTNLLPIDVHIARQLADQFDFKIAPEVFTSVRRSQKFTKTSEEIQLGLMGEKFSVGQSSTQNVTKMLTPRQYEEVESQARKYFSKDERLLKMDGKLNMALVASILWWRGANRGERNQIYVTESDRNHSLLPYGNLTAFNS